MFNAARANTVRPRLSPSMGVALVALFAALGGSGWAVDTISDPATAIVCDGSNDTEEIQASIDAARRPGGLGGRVELPAGTCVIARTLVVRGVSGMTLQGEGASATDLRWSGDPGSPVLLLDRARRARLQDFAITADRELASAIRIEHGKGCTVTEPPPHCVQWASSQAVLRDLVLQGEGLMRLGVHVALADVEADVKNDLHRFDSITASAYTDSAFRLESLCRLRRPSGDMKVASEGPSRATS